MIAISRIIGQPAVSLGDAERHGSVTGVSFEANRIVSLDVGGNVIPIDAVKTLEGDTITFERASVDAAATGASSDDDQDGQRSGDDAVGEEPDAADGSLPVSAEVHGHGRWSGDPIGKLLLSESGTALGKVAEIHVESDGTVSEIVDDSDHSYAGVRLLAVGSFAAILTDESGTPTT